jgi:NTP pyrophosphatase (non-canonical NTP hydrolase)
MRHPLSFFELRRANVARCQDVFHPIGSWSPTDWACALAGEVGEACNLIKKLRRGEPVDVGEIMLELADTVIYADLLAARLGMSLNDFVIWKFNQVSLLRGSARLLGDGATYHPSAPTEPEKT